MNVHINLFQTVISVTKIPWDKIVYHCKERSLKVWSRGIEEQASPSPQDSVFSRVKNIRDKYFNLGQQWTHKTTSRLIKGEDDICNPECDSITWT